MKELKAELSKLILNTTLGHDHIPNKLLRNLDDLALEHLLQCINDHWASGTLLPQQCHANITLIPKSLKFVSLSNLRPVSLTSYVGKLMEHLVHTQLTNYSQYRIYRNSKGIAKYFDISIARKDRKSVV